MNNQIFIFSLAVLIVTSNDISAQQVIDSSALIRVAQIMSQPNLIGPDFRSSSCEDLLDRLVVTYALEGGEVIYYEVFSGQDTRGCSYLLAYSKLTNKMYRLSGFETTDARNFFTEVDDYMLNLVMLSGADSSLVDLFDRVECLRRYSRLSYKRQIKKRDDYPCASLCERWLIIH